MNDSRGWNSDPDCAAGNLEFDATGKVADAAKNNWASVTFGLYASNETDTYGWKRFDPKTATLEVGYNTLPEPPESLGTSPQTSCTSGGLIGNTKVSLYATVRDEDGGNMTARFQVFKTGSTTAVVNETLPAANGRVVTLPVPDALLPTGSYTWKVQATDKDGANSDWSRTCTFSVDRTRPSKPPVITSEGNLFPPGDAGWPAVTGKARQTGNFLFSANGVADVDHYMWWTDYDPTVKQVGAAAASVPVTPPGYGPHLVYAYSVDKADNRSDTATYLYYANAAGERDREGDLDGDGRKDIWSIDSNGTLLTYQGKGNGDFWSAVNGGDVSFAGSTVAASGDWGQDGYNDLVSLTPDTVEGKKKLWTYANNGVGVIDPAKKRELTVRCPVVNEDEGCFEANDHWSGAQQVIAAGDMNKDGNPDLLVKEGRQLWAYYGSRRYVLDRPRKPILVGDGDWDAYTIVVPGDVNGDQLPDLWLRHDATGDLYRAYGEKDSFGNVDPTTWGIAANRVKIGTGVKAADYPTIGSAGDVTGDGLPDLWARKADNTMHAWPGKTPGADGIAFGTSFVIDGITGGVRIASGATIAAGQSYASRSMKLTMQTDGNLVITNKSGTVVWQTNTAGNSGATAHMSDGKLAVYAADGSTVLWNTETSAAGGYALLQDRGNLTIYNAKGQSIWASGTAVRHDYTNDGRSDMADWYDYADGSDKLHVFPALSNGAFNAPIHAWASAAGNYWAQSMKHVTGDFNGDGIGDIAAFYGNADGAVHLRTWLGKGDGNFNEPFASWSVKPGNWSFDAIHAQAGDFNGDGRDDIAAWYAYGDGSDKLFTFTANVKGGFNYPFSSFYRADGWSADRMKFATGDYNGDGRDDLGALYGYSDGTVKLITFPTKPDGGFAEPIHGWESTGWTFSAASVHSGDFNGDGRDDIASWYDYGDGHDAVISFNASGVDGKFGNRQEILNIEAGNYWRSQMKLVTGDYNGDGRDDLATLYGYTDGRVKAITWTAKPDGTLNNSLHSWEAPAGSWTFSSIYMIERYSPA